MVDEATKQAILDLRVAFKESDDQRDAGLPTEVPGVTRHNDLAYGADPKWHRLDIYLPDDIKGKIPVIINIHGGGWCYGTKETYQFFGLGLAKRGFAFVNPNYRLAPEVQFPGEMDDVNRYLHWVDEHADEYQLDRQNVFLMGDSAGGQMAEQYVTILTNPEYRDLFNYKLTQLKIRAVAFNSAAFFTLDEGMLEGAVTGYFTGEVLNDPKLHDMIDTEKYITKDFLPSFMTTANEDFIRDQTMKFDGFLRAKGLSHVTKSYGDDEHPEGHVFICNQKDALAQQAMDEEVAFFKQYLV